MVYAKGKRTIVYKLFNFIIKVKRKESFAIGSIKNEGKWLRKLNKYGIGPRLYYFNKKFLICEFINGDRILNYFKKCSLNERRKVVKEVLRQCYVLDKLKVDKFEMHHPLKHVIIGKKIAFLWKRNVSERKTMVTMIDFERCKYSSKPKNVTGFCQFLNNYYKKVDSDKLREILKKYKESYSNGDFDKLSLLFCD